MNAPVAHLRCPPPVLADAQASCPRRLGWMTGSPPPAERMIRFEDGSAYAFPQLRWSLCNLPALVPTVAVPRGAGRAAPLPAAPRDDIDALRFTPTGASSAISWADALAANYTDGIAVLHRGRLVHERYFGALQPDGLHAAMSVSKAVLGLLAMMLVADGRLDPQAPVAEQLPELAGSARRDQMAVSRKPPSNHTFREPVFALSSDADASGANTEKSNGGRRPMAATRSDTMRTANPGNNRLNDAE